MALITKLDPNDEFWVDDLYDMDRGQLEREMKRYERLAAKYEQVKDKRKFGDQRLSYQFAHLRFHEAKKILKGMNNDS